MKNARETIINMIPTAKLYVRLSIIGQNSYVVFNHTGRTRICGAGAHHRLKVAWGASILRGYDAGYSLTRVTFRRDTLFPTHNWRGASLFKGYELVLNDR
jgi:hypothetical protein